jgi:hypothetical protein
MFTLKLGNRLLETGTFYFGSRDSTSGLLLRAMSGAGAGVSVRAVAMR